MPPVVSFVASSSNSGKTTLIEKIVPILKARGLRVAVIKHASKGFELDRPGKDSWRFREAGADAVVLVGPEQLAVTRRLAGPPSPEEVELLAGNVDIIIKEGFKQDAVNKIEVYRSLASGGRPLCLDDPSFLALVSDKPFPVPIPRFDLDDAEGVAEFIIRLYGLERGKTRKLSARL